MFGKLKVEDPELQIESKMKLEAERSETSAEEKIRGNDVKLGLSYHANSDRLPRDMTGAYDASFTFLAVVSFLGAIYGLTLKKK